MDNTGFIITGFVAAAALGAIIGLERQLGHDLDDPESVDVYAGVRTFALYGVWGAAAAWFGDEFGAAGFVVAASAYAALLVANYIGVAMRIGDWGTTTEAAAFATFAIGVLTWREEFAAALALAVGTAALLRAKPFLRGLTERFSADDVVAVLQFGVISAVVLPLVPNEDIGPFDAINLRKIWLMVIFVSAIGLLGYLALRILGSRGLTLTGLFGGLVSSTAVTLGFSRMSKTRPRVVGALTAGVIAASGLMYARVLIEALVIEPDLATKLAVPLIGLFLLVEGAAVVWWRRSVEHDQTESELQVSNPLTLSTALQFGALYGAIVFISKALLDRVGDASLNIVGAVSGINDVDAITLSTADLVGTAGLDPGRGAQVVLAAVTVNTLVKAAMALSLGSAKLGRPVAAVLGLAAAGSAASWIFV